jgi:tRNA threonylcarbamoyl adenosine modification protein YeaZ
MLILAIDTCGFFYSIAILRDTSILHEIRSYEKNMQCEELVSKIEILLRDTSLHYEDLNLIAVTCGPGTFNGVRIGMSAAYGISLAKNIKMSTMSTLEVMSYKKQANEICFAADAQVGFLQRFDINSKPISDVIEVRLDELIEKNILVFDVNNYDESSVSNAAIAGLISTQSRIETAHLFYGKPPSIHVKSDQKLYT